MGNVCGKSSSEDDNFSRPGRVVGSAPGAAQSAPKTAPVPKKVGGPPRTLGGSNSNEGGGGENVADARRRAAEAAEVSFCARRCKRALLLTPDHAGEGKRRKQGRQAVAEPDEEQAAVAQC